MATIIPTEIKSEIISLYEQGLSNLEIVKAVNKSRHSVRSIIDWHKTKKYKLNVPKIEICDYHKTITEMFQNGDSINEIWKKTGINKATIHYHIGSGKSKYTGTGVGGWNRNRKDSQRPELIRKFEKHEYHDIITELRNGGMSYRDITHSTGISSATICYHLSSKWQGGRAINPADKKQPKYKRHGRQNEITTQEELITKGFEFKKIRNLTIFENGEIFYNKEQLNHLIKREKRGSVRDYLVVNIPLRKGKFRLIAVHRLVAMAFIPNPNEFPNVLHIDLNQRNCHVDNLKWGFPRTKDRRTENIHKIQPFLDTFDYENAEHMIRAVYDFLKTGNEAPLRQVFLEEKKYFRTVIANELYGKYLFRKFPLAEEIFEWCVDEIISTISRGFYIPKYLNNISFIIWCREGVKLRTKTYLSKKSKESTYSESILYETMQESY